jgi:NADPH:quinone reductase-like Zn-dependent oxidoreductase
MKAAIIKKWGNPKVLHIENITEPIQSDDQILVKVFASSVNPVDLKHRNGNHKYILGAPFPIVLGYDVCGEVIKTGANIKTLKVGDIVFGDLDNKYGGALAEYAVGTEECFALKPENISAAEAAGFPLVSLTALQALRDKAGLKEGQTVLINGASGGVGHIAVQIAHIMGAKVIAVSSGKNKEFIEQLNPERIIDYVNGNVLELAGNFDVFFDVTGNYSFRKVYKHLNPEGIYVTTLPRPKVLLHKLIQPFTKGKKVKTLLRKHNAKDLSKIATWISEGKLNINIDKLFSIEDADKAHAYAETGRTRGKNIITISQHL